MENTDALQETIQGTSAPQNRICDICNKEFQIGDNAILYLSDVLITPEKTQIESPKVVSMFCADDECSCGRMDTLPIPWEGATEALIEVNIDAGWVFGGDIELLDVSTASDGIDWNPLEVPEAFIAQPAPGFFASQVAEQAAYAPQDVVTFIRNYGVDLGELIQVDGSFQLEKDVDVYRKEVLENILKKTDVPMDGSFNISTAVKRSKEELQANGVTKYANK